VTVPATSDILVLKLGGSVLGALPPAWWDDVARLARRRPLVCVHGWSRPLAELRERAGRETCFVISQNGHRSRLTDDSVLADIAAVSAHLRAQIVARLAARSVRAHGLVAAHDGLLEAAVRPQRWWVGSELKAMDNKVGPIVAVARERMLALLAAHAAIVVTPLARSPEHPLVNVDGDRAAASIARALGARDLVFATDVDGFLRDGSTIRRLGVAHVAAAVAESSGGMRKKLLAAADAVDGGVRCAAIGSAPVAELLAGRVGTQVVTT